MRTARLLVLAGTDRLDKELMIGQMQGKFQMEVVPGVGHMIQEVGNLYDILNIHAALLNGRAIRTTLLNW